MQQDPDRRTGRHSESPSRTLRELSALRTEIDPRCVSTWRGSRAGGKHCALDPREERRGEPRPSARPTLTRPWGPDTSSTRPGEALPCRRPARAYGVASVREETFLERSSWLRASRGRKPGTRSAPPCAPSPSASPAARLRTSRSLFPASSGSFWTSGRETAEPFSATEFVRRVARREGIDGQDRDPACARCVHRAWEAASPDAMNNLAAAAVDRFRPAAGGRVAPGGSATPQARAGGVRGEESRGEARDRLPVGRVSESRRSVPLPLALRALRATVWGNVAFKEMS